MEIKFLRDDAAKEREEAFNEVLSFVKKDVKKERDLMVGKRFLCALFTAGKNLRESIERERVVSEFEQVKKIIPKIPVSIQEPEIKREIVKKEKPKISEKEPYSKKYSLLVSISNNITFATVSIDLINEKYKYNLIEPDINLEILQKIKENIRKKFEKDNKILENNKFLTKAIKKLCKKFKVEFSESYFNNIKYYLFRDFLNFRRIDPLLYDKNILSIACQGINKPVIVNYKDLGKIETNVTFTDNEEINSIIKKFASKTNNEVSKDKPVLSTILYDLRIEANFSIENSTFTIKRISTINLK